MEIQNKDYPIILNNFRKELYSNEASEETINNYSLHIAEFLRFAKHKRETKKNNYNSLRDIKISKLTNKELNEFTIDDINDYKFYLKDVKKNSANSIGTKLSSLDTFYNYCSDPARHIVDNNLMNYVKRPKQKRRQIKALETEEVKKLLNTIENSDSKYMLRDKAIFTIFLNTGLRFKELVQLSENEIKSLTSNIEINGKGNKVRGVFFNEDCVKAIKEYLPLREKMLDRKCVKNDELLFISQVGTELSDSRLNRILKGYCTKAGIDEKKVHLHVLRHTFATTAYNNGTMDLYELKEALGHSKISTTTIYAEMKKDKLKKAMNSFHY